MLPTSLRRLPLFATAVLTLFGLPAIAATLTVPTQYSTIQAAVNASASGDTVLIADGTYTGDGNRDIDFGGKNITVTSQHGASSTIIDCGGSTAANHRGFYLHTGETAAVISGLTIQSGYGGVYFSGGGICSLASGLSVQSCVFKNDVSNNSGGGIYSSLSSGTLKITSCIFTGNTAGSGGGIEADNLSSATTTITNCVLTGNASSSVGGGIRGYNADYCSTTITNCTLTGNTATSGAGGLYSVNSGSGTSRGSLYLSNDIFYGDGGGEFGGNVAEYQFQVNYCDIQNQGIDYSQSGSGDLSADPEFFSTSDLHLQAFSPCAGKGTAFSAPTQTIDGKTRPNPPSIGAYETATTGATATTTTLISSSNPSSPKQSVTLTATVTGSGGLPTGTVTFLEDGAAPVRVPLSGGKALYTTAVLTSGQHIINAGYSGDASFASSTSPALTQTVNFNSTTTTIKSSGSPSVFGQQVVFTATVTGSGQAGIVTFTDVVNGMTTTNSYFLSLPGGTAAYTTSSLAVGTHQVTASYGGDSYSSPSSSAALTQAVNQAATTTTVVSSLNPAIATQSVTFTATIATAPPNTATGAVSFTVDGVLTATPNIGGGAASFDVSTLTAGTHKIIASYSGDANFLPSTSTAFLQVVSPHVSPLYVSPTGSDSNPGTLAAPKLTIQAGINAVFTGDTVTVEDGTYTGPGDVDLDFGGRNITVASQHGAVRTIIDCGGTLTADHRGFTFHSGETNAVISGLTIQNAVVGGSFPNSNNYPGGGIFNYGASLTIQGCIFRSNAANQGGGFYNSIHSGTVTVVNCVFIGNTANIGGAYADNSEGGLTSFVNCTITGNKATGTGYGGTPGGGIYSFDHPYPATSSILILTNDILYGDTGGEIVNASTANAAANNCDIQGGYPGTVNINADPLFVNSLADLRLRPESPCVGMGTTGPSVPATTIDGQARPDPPSIGAYEAVFPTFLINDTDAGLTYNGGWFYSPGRGTGDLRDDVHAAQANGSAVTYSFLGTGVSVLAETNSDEGTVAVYIDGAFKQTVSCYSASRQVQQSVYSIVGLPSGLHSITLVKTGGTYTVVDGFQITTAPGAAAMNLINDTSGAIQYAGPNGSASWFYSPGRGLGDAGDDVHAATADGSFLIYRFNGTAVSYVTETNSDEGNVDVALDGAFQATVSCVSAARKTRQIVWSKSGLAPGPHTLFLGKKDGQYMLLDALLVTPSPTVVNDGDPGFLYNGGGWFYNYGRGVGDLGDDVHASQNSGDSVSYTFTGTSVSYITETNPDEGTVAVYIDGLLQKTVSCVTPTRQVQQTVFSASGLTPGSHTVTLVKTGGPFMVLDALSFQ